MSAYALRHGLQGRSLIPDGQREVEGGAFARPGINQYPAAMSFDKTFADKEAEAQSRLVGRAFLKPFKRPK
jgi:hypothetical protein